jgi:hypothetical protein
MKLQTLSWWVRFGLATLLILVVSLLGASCAPAPRNVPCSNGGQCEEASKDFHYCLQSRCVECVSSSSCGERGSCIDGECRVSCQEDRGCPQRQVCREGTCERL